MPTGVDVATVGGAQARGVGVGSGGARKEAKGIVSARPEGSAFRAEVRAYQCRVEAPSKKWRVEAQLIGLEAPGLHEFEHSVVLLDRSGGQRQHAERPLASEIENACRELVGDLAGGGAAGLHVQSRRIDFDVPSGLMKLDDSSVLQIQMSYALERGAAVWDTTAIYVSTEMDSNTYVGLIRQPKPDEAAGKELNDRWLEMLGSKGAFAPERGYDSDFKKLWRRAAVGADYQPGASVDPGATLLYEVLSAVQEPKLPRRIDDMHDLLLENIRVKER